MAHTDSFVSIADAQGLRGKRVLLRTGINVPLVNGEVRNSFRIEKALKTIMFLQEAGAKTVVIGHIGRDPKDSLKPVHEALSKHIKVAWCGDIVGVEVEEAVSKLKEGETVLLENTRSHAGEVENDDAFARELATYGDVYVNDAFSVAHREHASIVGVPKYLPAYAGLLFVEEFTNLSQSRTPQPPSLFVLGGAKFETKMPLVEAYIKKYDRVFVGGALANDIFNALGVEVGASMMSKVDLKGSSLIEHNKLILPVDVTVYGPEGKVVKDIHEVTHDETILDAGPKTVRLLEEHIKHAKTVLWNGPLGDYERGFCEQTEAFAKMLAETSAFSVVGGGDTVAAIESLNVYEKFNFVSTAGGSMLQFLEQGTLVGIEALKEEAQV